MDFSSQNCRLWTFHSHAYFLIGDSAHTFNYIEMNVVGFLTKTAEGYFKNVEE